MSPIVEIRNLKKRYAPTPGQQEGQFAVKGVDLTVEKGEIFSLLGPNGAGKTTTISMICGLLTPTEGEVLVGGHSIVREPMAVKRLLGIVPQEIALYPQLSARQNLEFFGKLYGLSGSTLAQRCNEVLDVIGLLDRQKEQISSYSGGMKRRVNIGVGLLHRPELVIMDEPTVGIDPQSRRNILDTVKSLNQQGMTVLYTTHYMEEAEELSDRVAIIDHGQIIALGKQGDLIQKVGEKDVLLIKVGEAGEQSVQALKGVAGIDSAALSDGDASTVRVLAGRGRAALPLVIKALDDAGIAIHTVEVREPNLEAVFLQLTGRALRD